MEEVENNYIVLAEPLHTVIQGEGELMGRKMVLMRVFGCPIQCRECDSYHTWDTTRLTTYKKEYTPENLADELFKKLRDEEIDTVLITGGEPQLYRNQLAEMIEFLQSTSPFAIYFDIETTGSVEWTRQITKNETIHFDLSPKIGSLQPGARIKKWRLFEPENIPFWYNLKVVTSRETFNDDILIIKDFCREYDIPHSKVYLMPLGTTREEMIQESAFVLEKAMEHHFNFSPRLHLFIYDNKRLV